MNKTNTEISNHTPGPWTYMYTRIGHTVRQSENAMSALMVVNVTDNPKADGMLMAAAPDLLAALRASQKAIYELRLQGAPTAFWNDIEAANIEAINKATKEK